MPDLASDFVPPSDSQHGPARRYRIFLWVGPLLALSWLTLTLLDPDPGRGASEAIGLGYFFGSLFGHATLAAAWAAFGPGRLLWRLPLSLVWLFLLSVGVQINIEINGGPHNGAVLLGACMLGQWFLLQFPLWGLALGLRMRLRHTDEIEQGFDPRQWQFGIGQLIIITAIVGVTFGVGRMVFTALGDRFTFGGEGPVLMFLAAAAIVLTLPLLLAGLMRRLAVPGVLLALALIAGATFLEFPLLRNVMPGPGLGTIHLAAINAFSAAMVLAIVTVVRLNGYSLSRYLPASRNAAPA
jgi:hypothetical protein